MQKDLFLRRTVDEEPVVTKRSAFLGVGLFCAVTLAAMSAFGAAPSDKIVIGLGAPLTGSNATAGEQMLKGAQQAAKDINAAGGINGKKIEIMPRDDAGDPKQGVAVANDFAAAGVRFVDGHWNSSVSIPASYVYNENGILMVSVSSNPKLTENGFPRVIRTLFRDNQQGILAGQYIASHFPGAKVAVIHDKSAYGEGIANETRKTLHEQGITEVLYEGITPGERDYSALISKMKRAGVTFIYFGGYHTEAGLILRQMKSAGLKARFMGPNTLSFGEFSSIAGDAVEGVIFTFVPDPRKNPKAANVVKEFLADGFDPEAYTLCSYAAIQLIAEAANKIGSDDPKAVADAIKNQGPWSTVIGDLSFDKKGDPVHPAIVVYTWRKDGGFVESE